jgi:carbonic anhydrase
MTNSIQAASCACCTDLPDRSFGRRYFLQAVAAGAAAAAVTPLAALAAEGKYEALTLSCIDPRTQEGVRRNMAQRRLIGKYSQVILAGGAIGVVAPAFKDWHKTFWDNLGASVQLHSIKKVVVINHRDCGAAKIAYGPDAVKTRDAETALHRNVFAEFRKQCAERHPKLAIETGIIALNGRVEMIA